MTNREIDALVAENCMGWIIDPDNLSQYIGSGSRMSVPNWRPSEDSAASKALRDKMRADGWEYFIWSLVKAALDEGRNEYCAGFWKSDDPIGIMTAHGTTEELAVALAALKAKGVDVA